MKHFNPVGLAGRARKLKSITPTIMVVLALFSVLISVPKTRASSVRTQVCMVIDGSGSISSSEWATIKNGIATAINTTVPRDGSVELTIVQFGYSPTDGYAKTEIQPTVVDGLTYSAILNQVLAMPKGGQSTPMAHGLYLGWKNLRNSPNYAFSAKQVVNLATDGVPNVRNNNATSDLDGSGSIDSYDDVIAVVDHAVSQGLDELDAEGIGISNSSRDWIKNWTVRPQPGITAPPFTKQGWVRLVANATEFANTINQKFELILGNAKIQLCMIIDGSGSISSTEWATIKNGTANALRNNVPHDGSVELSIVQFGYSSGSGYAKVEIQPTIVTSANYEATASAVTAITQGAGSTPMAHGLYLGWKTIESSVNFPTSTRQVINLATDGDPNVRNNNATSDLDGSGGSPTARDDVIAVVDYAVSQGLDELDAEGIGISNSSRDWIKNWTVRPQPGNLAPPFNPGWIRVVANSTVFAGTVGEKFNAVLVDHTPPTITDVYQQPAADNVTSTDIVEVFANVTDDLSGVKRVLLNYTVDGSSTYEVEMSNLQGDLYNATIPQFPYGTHVTYTLTAEDHANNSITTQALGYYYGYQVIPEFSLALASLSFTGILLTVLIRRTHAQRSRIHNT